MLIIGDSDNQLRLDIGSTEAYQWWRSWQLNVEVQSEGYRGWSDPWLDAESLEQFGQELSRLNEQLRGEVQLDSMSPGEFTMTVKSIDSLGHLAFDIMLSRLTTGHQVQVSFPIELHWLQELIDWVQNVLKK